MTRVNSPQSPAVPRIRHDADTRDAEPREVFGQHEEGVNVADGERSVSVAAGAILALLGVTRRSIPGLIIAGVGGGMLYRGITGHCPVYSALDIDGTQEEADYSNGIHVEQSFLINKSPEELYRYWRNFENLPRIMTHLESVRVIDDRRSHWVARAPRLAGGQVEWDAEITSDEPNSLIAWRSLPGADVDNTGEVRFAPGMGDRGSEVHVTMTYVPPAGRLGNWIAKLLGENPNRVIREDLRNFKRIMELGEILTIIGQPRGTCTGQGERQTESEWRPLFK